MSGRYSVSMVDRSFDVLKFFAALSIYYYHFFRALGSTNLVQWYFDPQVLPGIAAAWTWKVNVILQVLLQNFGYLGVTVFIIASGWGLARSCLRPGRDRTRWSNYLPRRLGRILPLYAVALIVALAFALARNNDLQELLFNFFLSLLLLHTVIPASFFSINSAFWFLPTLLVLYALFPALYVRFTKHPHRTLLIVALLAYVNVLILWFTPLRLLHPYLVMGGWPLVKILEFGFGIWLAIVLTRTTASISLLYYLRLAFLGVMFWAIGLFGLQVWWLYIQHPFFLTVGILGIFSYPIFFLAQTKRLGAAVRFLGRYSYGLFLFHWPVLHWWIPAVHDDRFGAYPLFSATMLLVLLWPASIYIERVVRHRIERV